MKKKEANVKENNKHFDKGQIFVKIMAAILAVLMMAGTVMTLVYALMG